MMKCRACGKEIIVGTHHKCTGPLVSPQKEYSDKFKEECTGSDGFMKADNGKVMASLVDPDFVLGVADILTFGAKKYAKNNWQKNTDLDRYKDSFMRHVYAYLGGELIDPESGKPHLDHIACNIMFIRYFEHGKGKKKKEVQ